MRYSIEHIRNTGISHIRLGGVFICNVHCLSPDKYYILLQEEGTIYGKIISETADNFLEYLNFTSRKEACAYFQDAINMIKEDSK